MQLPRVRFTIRRMMVAVALSALSLVVLIPVGSRLRYAYEIPFSAGLVYTKVMPRDVGHKDRPVAVDQPVAVRCPYEVSFDEHVPSWLPYWVTIEIQLIDEKSRVVEEMHWRGRYMLAGREVTRVDFDCELTPRHAGRYRVRYAMGTRDLFGRKGGRPGSISTNYLTVH